MLESYKEFPPVKIFKRVLREIPEAALIYAALWSNRKKAISIFKNSLSKEFLISTTKFRNLLLDLTRIEVLSFEETTDYFVIKLCDYFDD